MNILVLSSYNDAWNSVRPEAEIFIALAKAGHNVTILTQEDAAYVQRFKANGITVIDHYPKRKICLKTIKYLRALFAKQPIDIVYAMNSRTIANAAFACIGFDSIKLVTYRGTVGGVYRLDPSAYLTHLHPRVDGIACVSNAVEKDLKTRVWRIKDKVTTVYKGHDIAWYQTKPACRERLHIPEDAFCVICIANTRPSKGVAYLLESAKQLRGLNRLHLLLVGRNMDTEAHKQLANDSGMVERIHFLGYRDDVPALIAASNVQVQPSISGEGLPKTFVEAMAMAIPSIVTTTGGAKEFIDEAQSGFVVPTRDSYAISEKIKFLYKRPEQCQTMGNLAQAKMIKDLSSQKSASDLLSFFQYLMQASS
ncbi:glycosyl transferase family 1 [Salinivibrio sp. ML323]|uniref:glycosyltransferase family 4 protein n=1 Tax=unclassified Salinivibrio TaxID=2636825 RepID=UPI000985BE15|nr:MULTISPECIES: glycosyltransferase family 4 protein [unclassified Salinivibrio]OOE58600.1 glycosyl transferase family 1 [Salinivibrio sp. ML323]OOE66166.1 glycosyl transferase family 1 [Salinivibrio sp. IB282]